MTGKNKDYGRKYISEKKDKGYCRVNKWCPVEYRKAVNAVIDILSCHKESPDSTEEFHPFILQMIASAEIYEREYEVKDDNGV